MSLIGVVRLLGFVGNTVVLSDGTAALLPVPEAMLRVVRVLLLAALRIGILLCGLWTLIARALAGA